MQTVALQRLLAAGHLSPSDLLLLPASAPPPPPRAADHHHQREAAASPPPKSTMKPCYYVSPALYTTPISSPSTHPYLLNRKGLRASPARTPPTLQQQQEEEEDEEEEEEEARSVGSGSSSGLGCEVMAPPQLTQTEYYDAAEDFFSDSSVSQSSFTSKLGQNELHALRLNLSEEAARRTMSEESLLLVQNQLKVIVKLFAQLHGSMPVSCHLEDAQFEADPAQLCQEIVVLSFVSEEIEKTMARVEAKAIVEEVIDSKNNEICRLRDRLQYYETVNREMTLRNQAMKEVARQQWFKREQRQRFVWGCVGLAVTVGTSWLAYSCLINTTESSSSTSSSSGSAESCA